MEASVVIDGREVRFRATAAVPLMYRVQFKRDLLRDVQKAAAEVNDESSAQCLETIERMAYIMAKHADPVAVSGSFEDWLSSFSPMAIYSVIPVIMALWSGNVERLEEAKKKLELLNESSQRHSSCSGPSV